MAIFNSYVKLPEGNHGKCAKIIENDHWGYPFMTIPPKFVDQNAKKRDERPRPNVMGESDASIHGIITVRWENSLIETKMRR